MAEETGAAEEQLPPFIIEAARSSRSKCKTCRRAIQQGVLRLGIMIVGPYGTGYLWHHLTCAARSRMDDLEEAYAQEAWTNAKEPPADLPSLDELRRLRDDAEVKRKQRKVIPYVELAPSARSKCQQCDGPIEKDGPRVVLGRGVYFGTQVRTSPINVHAQCVAAALQAEDCTTEAEGLADALRANSKDMAPERLESVIAQIGDPFRP
jgi:hypothetical protein